MVKLLLGFCCCAFPVFAVNAFDCLVIDNAHPISKNQYVIVGHNKCNVKVEGHHLADAIFVYLKFYDSAGYRIGNELTLVAPLDPGEKFRHVWPISSSVSGIVVRIKVDKID